MQEIAERLGISILPHEKRLLLLYLDELWKWNRKVNLVAPCSRTRIITELILDSLVCASFLPEKGKLLDIGSGAGLPAIPLKIKKPLIEMDLVEPRSKRVVFLRHIKRTLGLENIRIIRGRTDQDTRDLDPNGYNIITARALAPLPTVIKWAYPWMKPGGILIDFQGKKCLETVQQSHALLEEKGLEVKRYIPYSLPGKDQRYVLIIRRVR